MAARLAAAPRRDLEAATGDFCLALDADEELPAATRSALRDAVARADAAGLAGLSMIVRNLAPPASSPPGTTCRPCAYFAAWRRTATRGESTSSVRRESCAPAGHVGQSNLVVLHHGYARSTAQGGAARAQRNLALLEEAVRDAPDDAYLLYELARPRRQWRRRRRRRTSSARWRSTRRRRRRGGCSRARRRPTRA